MNDIGSLTAGFERRHGRIRARDQTRGSRGQRRYFLASTRTFGVNLSLGFDACR